MNTNTLRKSDEIKKIINEIGIPIDDFNFMPGELQVELRYRSKTIGYILCSDEGNVMHYKGRDALTQKHLDWHFVYQQNKKIIDEKIIKLVKNPTAITPASFRQVNVRTSMEMITPLQLECTFDGLDWNVRSN
ncbi:MAG: hypothetical protein WDN75_13670 [Bacteroidota bacterium]